MAVTYERVNWVDEPSTDTPLSAENLNKMDEGISELAEWSENVEESIDERLETKADNNGSYDYLTAGLANQLATDKGITDSIPYLMRPSGGGVAVGTYEQDKIVGGSVVWNQLVDANTQSVTVSSGHKIYAVISGTASVFASDGAAVAVTGETDMLIDLTAMFGTAVADYIHSLETATPGAGVAFFRGLFPDSYYAYSSGEIKSVSGLVSHTMRDADDNIIAAYPLDTDLVLRGIPKITDGKLAYDGDTYSADGTMERRFGITSFVSAKSVVLHSSNYYYTTFSMPDDALSDNSAKTLISNGYNRKSTVVPGQYYITNAGKILVIIFLDQTMTDLATVNNYLADNPITLIYELATFTTEQAAPYQTPQLVDPDGTEEYVLADGAFPMPVGHETFYPVNLKKKIEDLPDSVVSDVQVDGVSVVQDGVANIPIANADNFGVVKKNLSYGIDITSSGQLILIEPTAAQLKSGYAGSRRPILTSNQHASAFYGLAKAAGDTTQSASSNAVGTYTDEAKKAIRKMLGIPNMTSELISEITTTEDLERFEIETDANGLPFALRACKIYVKLPASTTGVSDFIAAQYRAVDMNDTAVVTSFPTIKMTAASGSLLTYEFESFPGGMYFVRAFVSSNFGSSSGQMISMQYDKLIKYTNRIILKQYGQATTLIPAGTIIKLYGIRYDD